MAPRAAPPPAPPGASVVEEPRAHTPHHEVWWGQRALFVLLGLLLGVALVAAGSAVYAVQGRVASLTSVLPVGYAFAAGMVATVNPCGVLLLPSLVAYYLGQAADADASGWRRAGKALVLGATATLGFVVLFGAVGAAVGLGGRALGNSFPVGGLVVGVGMTLLGVWLAITGNALGVLAAGRALGRVRIDSDLPSLFLFGVGYGVASLACTLPIFMVVVGTALAAGGVVAATTQFVGYALGMGTVLTLVVVGAALFRAAVTRWVRQVVPYVHRLAASFLIGAGLYITVYWLAALRLLR